MGQLVGFGQRRGAVAGKPLALRILLHAPRPLRSVQEHQIGEVLRREGLGGGVHLYVHLYVHPYPL